jgi:hypothetical protein
VNNAGIINNRMKNPTSQLNKGDLLHLGVNLINCSQFMKITECLLMCEPGILEIFQLYTSNVCYQEFGGVCNSGHSGNISD